MRAFFGQAAAARAIMLRQGASTVLSSCGTLPRDVSLSRRRRPREHCLSTASVAAKNLRRINRDEEPPQDAGRLGEAIYRLERWLGAKQDAIRDREMAVLAEFGRLMETLDGSFDAPSSLEFTSWLGAREAAAQRMAEAADGARLRQGGVRSAAAVPIAMVDSGAATKRAKALLADAEKQLAVAISTRAKVLGGAPLSDKANPRGMLRRSGPVLPLGKFTPLRELAPRELETARLVVWLCFLRRYAAHLATALDKGLLRSDFDAVHAAAALREALGAGVEARLRLQLRLFDRDSDGWLDDAETAAAVEAMTEPLRHAVGDVHAMLGGLDKAARRAMPKAIKWAAWDVLELPVKRRCAFAWGAGLRETGPAPTDRAASVDGFVASQQEHFRELGAVSAGLTREVDQARWDWHDMRKRQRRVAIYGLVLFAGTVTADALVQLM
ncbi:unnamed protein product [Phaeothamnion confervicola]